MSIISYFEAGNVTEEGFGGLRVVMSAVPNSAVRGSYCDTSAIELVPTPVSELCCFVHYLQSHTLKHHHHALSFPIQQLNNILPDQRLEICSPRIGFRG